MPLIRRPEPPVLRRRGFTLCLNTWDVSGIPRIEGARLQELFRPQRLRLKRDQKKAEAEAKQLFKKDFFAAQLRYYGIPFPSTAKVADLRNQLETSTETGKCNKVPTSVLDIEMTMRKEYVPILAAWESMCEALETETTGPDSQSHGEAYSDNLERSDNPRKRLRTKTTARKSAPDTLSYSSESSEDGNSEDGQSIIEVSSDSSVRRDNPRKRLRTKQTARKSTGGKAPRREWRPADPARNMPLYRSESDDDGDSRDSQPSSEVSSGSSMCRDNPRKRLRTKQTARKSTGGKASRREWKPAGPDPDIPLYYPSLEDDDDSEDGQSVSDGFSENSARNDNPRKQLRTKQTARKSTGGKTRRQEWKPVEEDAKPTIPSKYLGSYVVKCKKITEGWDMTGDLTIDICPGSQSDNFLADFDFGIFEGTMILSESKQALSRMARCKYDIMFDDDDDDNGEDGRATRRLYFFLRGRETGEGQIFPDPQSGYLEFTDGTFRKFKGSASMPYVSNPNFSGRRVHDTPLRRPQGWDAFSEAEYDRACINRWR